MHPQATKHREKRKKKREPDFVLRFGDGAHPFPEATKQKERKKGSWPLSKVGDGTHQNKKNKIKCLPLSSCFQTLHSSTSKLFTLQALSSLNPNVQPASDGVIARGVWEGWVGRKKEVDGLVGGRVVGRLEA
jgi:hypothetical protein